MSECLLNAAQVAEILGFSAGTIVDWIERGDLPAFKIGNRWRLRESEVIDWLDDRRVNGPGTRGEVSPTPNVDPARVVVLQASPTPSGGEHAG